jgi:hypothetical protein
VVGFTAESNLAGCARRAGPNPSPNPNPNQVQLCMLVFCLLLALISLIALSWRKYGTIILRSRHDPSWKVRELSPSMGPILRGTKSPNKKKD